MIGLARRVHRTPSSIVAGITVFSHSASPPLDRRSTWSFGLLGIRRNRSPPPRLRRRIPTSPETPNSTAGRRASAKGASCKNFNISEGERLVSGLYLVAALVPRWNKDYCSITYPSSWRGTIWFHTNDF
ncbi:hypothetical protein GUJ93_ZPchr0006g42427 [Zizania palustris]|uniref:Uncharacterized protein n=1 Tax=Zizania palustris TaxID=103762 RepID=A0A8J5VI12_ZIZPA|nr:hypothetical protein GUJ93_ZPchr0006g42427 [Zizania palustris]